jgi:hypothetical protein
LLVRLSRNPAAEENQSVNRTQSSSFSGSQSLFVAADVRLSVAREEQIVARYTLDLDLDLVVKSCRSFVRVRSILSDVDSC